MTQQQTRYVVAAIVVAALLLMIALTGGGDLGGSPRDGRGMTAATATLYGAILRRYPAGALAFPCPRGVGGGGHHGAGNSPLQCSRSVPSAP
jgi:hypothetical protein